MTEKTNKPFYDDKDYRREYKLRETDLIGIYTPANQQHPAYSAPPPDYTYTFTKFLTSADLKFYNSYYYQCIQPRHDIAIFEISLRVLLRMPKLYAFGI